MVKKIWVVDIEGTSNGKPIFWELGRYDSEMEANLDIQFTQANLTDFEMFDNLDAVTFTIYTDTEWIDDGYETKEDW